MQLRRYRESDAAATRRVFERAVRVTAASDYTDVQLEAWAPVDLDDAEFAAWGAARAAAHTIVAVENDEIVGFCDLVDGTALDMLYVDPRYSRGGLGSALVGEVIRAARSAGTSLIETDASLTARPLFERHGFVVVARQTPVVRGVAMTNFKMRLDLGA